MRVPVSANSVLESFAAWVAHAPQAIAVEDGATQTTYREIWHGAGRVKLLLADAGVRSGDIVALAGPRGADLAAAIYGTWLAGASYLPLDPDLPRERMKDVLADSGAVVALAGEMAAPAIGSAAPPGRAVLALPPLEPAPAVALPDPVGQAIDTMTCAYVIYTSGSTGRPKGTRIAHRGLANVITHFSDELAVTPADAAIWAATISFDMSVFQLFLPLTSGARAVVATDEANVDGLVLGELIDRHGVNLMLATPTTWRLVLDQVADRLRGRRVMFGGEAASLSLIRRLLDTGARLHHLYGPTEASIVATSTPVTGPAERVSIGRPIRDTQAFVVDERGAELIAGERGELCVAGAGVALGYHNRPELTAASFFEHPRYGRCYRTGDLASWLPDGTLELHGRADRQVKVRGNRIELGDIEAALARHPGVRAAAVVVVGDPSADGAIVAFADVSPAGVTVEQLWEHARGQLPRAMLPQEIALMDALPVNASQKVDYPALILAAELRRSQARLAAGPDPAAGAEPATVTAVLADELVAELVMLWHRLLDRSDVTPETNFFVHGGHSLLGMVLLRQVEQVTGVSLRLADLFKHPTPARLAERVRPSLAVR